MTTLTESALTIDMTTLTAASGMPENWAEAPEFVPVNDDVMILT